MTKHILAGTCIFLSTALLLLTTSACDSRSEHEARSEATAAGAEQERAGGADKEAAAGRANSAGGSEHYSTESPDEALPVGQKSEAAFDITPTGDLKINHEFPWTIEFAEQDGIELAQASFSKDDFGLEDEAATLSVLMEADEAGTHQLEATADFSVCTDTECFVMRDEPLSFEVEAQASDGDD